MIPVISRRNRRNTIGKVGSKYYWLYDQFTTARSAGAVNGTLAEPTGGARVVNDNGFMSITGGVLSWASGGLQNNGIFYGAQTRALGKTFISNIVTTAGYALRYGFHTGQSGAISDGLQTGTTCFAAIGGSLVAIHGDLAAGTYQYAIVQRASGMFIFLKGGVFTNWTQMYNTPTTSTATMYPALITRTATAVFTADNMRVSRQLYIPAPLQSDGMSAATTDGLGNPENNGVAGNAYTNVGTWGVADGKRSCSALSGGLGFSYLACSSSNVIIEAVCTRSAGVTGLVARYADASNYLIAYHDGTNAKLDKVVAGTTTNLLSAAVTYAAAAVMSLHLDGTSARLFYNNTVVGTVATTPAAGSLNHGVYTTDAGATFDNLVIWPKGNSETQYAWLDTV